MPARTAQRRVICHTESDLDLVSGSGSVSVSGFWFWFWFWLGLYPFFFQEDSRIFFRFFFKFFSFLKTAEPAEPAELAKTGDFFEAPTRHGAITDAGE